MKKHFTINAMRALSIGLMAWCASVPASAQESVAQLWNETQLNSIKFDAARPTVQARNLYHASIALYDSWAVYNDNSETVLLGKTLGGYTCPFNGVLIPETAEEIQEAQEITMSYAMYRLMAHRYQLAPGVVTIYANMAAAMTQMGLNPSVTSIDYSDGDPAKLGNYIGYHLIQYGLQDGANETGNGGAPYSNQYYVPANSYQNNHIFLQNFAPGNPLCADPNRWQTLSLTAPLDQAGFPVPVTPAHLTPEWGNVVPFALQDEDVTLFERDGGIYPVYHDQGEMPKLDLENASDIESFYKWAFSMVPAWQATLDAESGVMMDISPGAMGNNTWYPENHNLEEYMEFYDYAGGDNSEGHDVNPSTGLPYEPQIVKQGDWARCLAEFWADGPSSETPPGHWFSVVNHAVFEHPDFEWKWNGQGEEMDHLEFQVKTYLALGGAVHDAAITCWGHKGYYDYARPIGAVRYMADQGQSTDALLPNYHPQGYPLVPGYSELVMPGDPLEGDNQEHLYKVKLWTWMGPPHQEYGTIVNAQGQTVPNFQNPIGPPPGTDWILAEQWYPYQRPNFVTPPFAGYMSGHSTYSRTAAELLTLVTGDNYFPGGMSNFVAPTNEFLVFEEGPSADIIFQWATYQDASDQCSLSRIFGGIHPVIDDIPGRHLGMILGPQAYEKADEMANVGVPKVISVSFAQSVVNDDLAGTTFGIIVGYNKPMDESIAPTLSFPGSDVSASLALAGFTWLDEMAVQINYTVTDANLEQTIALIKTEGAAGIDGKLQQVGLNTGFDIDTMNPTGTAAPVAVELVTDANSGNDVLAVSVTFNEEMNQMANPIVTYTGTMPGTALSANTGTWTSATEYEFTIDAPDTNVELEGIEIWVTAATDAAGNDQVNTAVTTLEIETLNPATILLSANDYILTDDNAGTATFEVLALFSEEMDTDTDPVVSFPDQDPVAAGAIAYNATSSAWLNNTAFAARFNVNDGNFQMADINIALAAATDAVGNLMVSLAEEDFFTIDLGVGINEHNGSNSLVLFPNPVPYGANLGVILPSDGIQLMEVFDMTGRLVFSDNVNAGSGTRLEISSSKFNVGMYRLQLSGSGISIGSEFLIVR